MANYETLSHLHTSCCKSLTVTSFSLRSQWQALEENCPGQLVKSKVLSSAMENCYISLNCKQFIHQYYLPKNGSFSIHSGRIHMPDMVINSNTLMLSDCFFCKREKLYCSLKEIVYFSDGAHTPVLDKFCLFCKKICHPVHVCAVIFWPTKFCQALPNFKHISMLLQSRTNFCHG